VVHEPVQDSSESLEVIFDPSASSTARSPQHGGVGLGLYIPPSLRVMAAPFLSRAKSERARLLRAPAQPHAVTPAE